MKYTQPLKSGSQAQKILHHLAHGHVLTPLSSLRLFDCLRLGARVYELKRRGWAIKTEIVRSRSGKLIAAYSM